MTAATAAQRVAKARAKLIEEGGRRVGLFLQPDAAKALDALLAAGYADSTAAVIATALLDAHKKIARRKP